jgi:hypothetical protein
MTTAAIVIVLQACWLSFLWWFMPRFKSAQVVAWTVIYGLTQLLLYFAGAPVSDIFTTMTVLVGLRSGWVARRREQAITARDEYEAIP